MGKSVNSIRLAADIGGTFTDVVLDTGQQLHTAKVPTNISDPEMGVLKGIQVVLDDAGLQPSDVDEFIHGTTLATNALIERKGVKTALITTEGFRDSIEVAAAYAVGRTGGRSPADATRFAVAAASLSCRGLGPRGAFPTRAEIESVIEEV